jgi:hypothetical protein
MVTETASWHRQLIDSPVKPVIITGDDIFISKMRKTFRGHIDRMTDSVFSRVADRARRCDAWGNCNEQENGMWLDGIRRLASRLGRGHRKPEARRESAGETSYDAGFDANWHGDHWQNLLASPLDARHYVMEDWADTPPPAESADAPPPPAKRRRRRRYEQ